MRSLELVAPAFVAMRLDPWRLRVFPGTLMFGTGGEKLTWDESVA